MLTSSQTLGWWIQNYGSIQDSRDFGGVVPAYPIFMFIGIIAVIIATIIKMRMKKIPLNELYWAILIIVPVGIIGGSIFGKVFLPTINNHNWYKVFFFWEPGMSLFGAVGLGTVGGFVWFYKRSKVTQISVWVYADCILPNVLIGQAIGRWGNLYNHEILGHAMSYDQLQWLVPGIRDKLFYWGDVTKSLAYLNLPNDWARYLKTSNQASDIFNSNNWAGQVSAIKSTLGQIMNDKNQIVYTLPTGGAEAIADALDGIGTDNGPIVFREPLFLYESLANTALWLILTFIVPNLSRWIQGKKHYPWDIQPNAYPGWYNPRIKQLPLDDIESWSVQRPIKYKKSADGEYTISLWEAWNKAYYLYEPNSKDIDELVLKQDKRMDHDSDVLDSLDALKKKHKSDLYRFNENFTRKTNILSKKDTRYIKLRNEMKEDIVASNIAYKSDKKELLKDLGGWQRYFNPNPDAARLEELNNPYNYFIVRSGVLSGAYVLGYMIIRIILETHRRFSELFVQNNPIPDYIVLGIILAAGLFIILWTTFVSPYKYREVGWLYEKSY